MQWVVCVNSRVHVLEEQLRDVENRAKEQMSEEQRKHREILVRQSHCFCSKTALNEFT